MSTSAEGEMLPHSFDLTGESDNATPFSCKNIRKLTETLLTRPEIKTCLAALGPEGQKKAIQQIHYMANTYWFTAGGEGRGMGMQIVNALKWLSEKGLSGLMDVGCGPSGYLPFMGNKLTDYYGVDVNRHMTTFNNFMGKALSTVTSYQSYCGDFRGLNFDAESSVKPANYVCAFSRALIHFNGANNTATVKEALAFATQFGGFLSADADWTTVAVSLEKRIRRQRRRPHFSC